MKIFLSLWFKSLDRFLPLVLCVLLLSVGLGMAIVKNSEIQAFPNFTNTQVQIITQLRGKAPEEIERLVTKQVEVGVAGIRGLTNTRSISVFGLSVVTLTFEDAISPSEARTFVYQRINDLTLPKGSEVSLSPESTPIGEIFRYVLKGSASIEEERLVQDWLIERKLKKLSGVADVITFGGPRQIAEVKLEPQRLRTYGLDLDKVAKIISSDQGNAGGTPIIQGQEATLIRILGMYENYTDLSASTITSVNGIPVHVRDLGEVKLGHDLRFGKVGFKDRDDVVEGIILLRNGYDTARTCEEIKATIGDLNRELKGKGIEIEPIYDRTELIQASQHTVIHNMVTGIFLVIFLLILGLGFSAWRLTLAVALLIPLSLIFALVGVKIFGLTPNLISIGAIDFGILVETAIFASEALLANRVFQASKEERNGLGVTILSKVLGPALLSSILLAIAFIPIITLTGVEGRIFKPLGVTLICAVLAAQVLTLLLLPLAIKFMPVIKAAKEAPLEKLSHALVEKLSLKLGRLKESKRFGASSAIALFASVLLVFVLIGKEFMPTMNEGAVYIRVIAPSSVSLATSTELAGKIRKSLGEIKESRAVVTQIGRPDDGTDVNGPEIIEALVRLNSPETWDGKDINDIISSIETKLSTFAGISYSVSQPIKDNVDEAISGVKGDLVLKFYGNDLNELLETAHDSAEILTKIRGVDSANVDVIKGQSELRFKINKEFTSRFGLRTSEIGSTLETALMGKKAGSFLDKEGRLIPILIKPLINGEMTIDKLKTIPVLSNSGQGYPLGELVDNSMVEGISRIYREQGMRTIAVKVNVSKRAVVDFVSEASSKLKKELKLSPDIKSVWAGSFENAQRASSHFLIMVPLCFFFIGLLVHAWYRSLKLTLLLFMEIPFALIGALLLLLAFDLNLSISAASGIIVVLGLALLNGMMYLERYVVERDAQRALVSSGAGIILSALVAIAGLVPAALSHSIGSETAKPFAVAILGGLISSLILTLVMLPIYTNLVAASDEKKE